jgi:hypothetical protein
MKADITPVTNGNTGAGEWRVEEKAEVWLGM